MAKVRISKPAKSSMQSGMGAEKWIIEFTEESGARAIDKTMGWTSSKDMGVEVKLEFASSDSAVEFSQKNGWSYEVIEPTERKLIKKSYADNFK